MKSTPIAPLKAALLPPTDIHQIIAPEHGLEPRGNATVQGRRYTVAGWRRLAAEIDPAHCGLDERRAIALLQAMRYLDLALDRPLHVWVEGRERVVELLGAFRYVANLDTRRLRCGRILRDGSFALWDEERLFGLFPAFQGDSWLPWLLDVSGLDWRCDRYDRDDVESYRPRDAIERRLVAILRRMIGADRRFRALRLAVAGRLVGEEILALAIRTRLLDPWPFLTMTRLEHVWRHHAHYAEAGRQAPGLLPLVPLALGERDLRMPPADVLHAMRAATCKGVASASGPAFGDAAWRWLLRHGLRNLRWVSAGARTRMEMRQVEQLLEAVADANWPNPPAQRFWRAWGEFNRFVWDHGCEIDDWMRWNQVPARLLRMLVAESARRSREPGFANWCDAARDALQALVDPRLFGPSRLGRDRLGKTVPRWPDWSWLEETAARRRARIERLAQDDGPRWRSLVGERRCGELLAVPLESAAALAEEGWAMRHCAAGHAEACAQGRMRFFSLRTANGRRVATAAIAPCGDGSWRAHEVRRRANGAPAWREVKAAASLAADYTEALRRAADEGDVTPEHEAGKIAWYEVVVCDNFHAPHPEAAGRPQRFETEDEALEYSRRIVDDFFDSNLANMHSVDEMRRQFVMFGETPIVTRIGPGPANGPAFSAIGHLCARAEAHFGSSQ